MMKALYLSDTDARRAAISRLLEQKDIAFERVDNVTTALRTLMTSRFELIISELRLKDLDAYDLIKLMRKFNLNQPVIVLDDETNDLERALVQNEGGFDLVNSKDLENLSTAIEEVLILA
ncbi:MAG: response regulator [Bacteroidota bacterium]